MSNPKCFEPVFGFIMHSEASKSTNGNFVSGVNRSNAVQSPIQAEI